VVGLCSYLSRGGSWDRVVRVFGSVWGLGKICGLPTHRDKANSLVSLHTRCSGNILRPSSGLVTAGEGGMDAVNPDTRVGTVTTGTRCLVVTRTQQNHNTHKNTPTGIVFWSDACKDIISSTNPFLHVYIKVLWWLCGSPSLSGAPPSPQTRLPHVIEQ
jgi:hypothetical protein